MTPIDERLDRARQRFRNNEAADRAAGLKPLLDYTMRELLAEVQTSLLVAMTAEDWDHVAYTLLVAELLLQRAAFAEVIGERMDRIEVFLDAIMRGCGAAITDLSNLCARVCVREDDLASLRDLLLKHSAVLLKLADRKKGERIQ